MDYILKSFEIMRYAAAVKLWALRPQYIVMWHYPNVVIYGTVFISIWFLYVQVNPYSKRTFSKCWKSKRVHVLKNFATELTVA